MIVADQRAAPCRACRAPCRGLVCRTCYLPETRVGAAGRLEDIHMMLDSGESPEGVATRLGIKRESVVRFLTRWGRFDLKERMSGA